jgi:ectoine hydroxylase-related dioxygenase (phytanoyl-CoA dioxygenase family)
MVTDEERYLFDLLGWLVVPDAIDAESLAALNAIMDERVAAIDPEASAFLMGQYGGEVIGWGAPFLELVDNPRITPYLEEFVNPQVRLDHETVMVMRPGATSLMKTLSSATLHAASAPYDSAQYFRFSDGRMWNGLTVVAYYLCDVGPGDGGLACVPGSHKSNYPLPVSLESALDGELPPWIIPIPARAGSAVIFTEAIAHGTLPWRAAHERRVLLYKYSPHAVAWSWKFYDADDYEGVTERQRAMLEPPNSRIPSWRGTGPTPHANTRRA